MMHNSIYIQCNCMHVKSLHHAVFFFSRNHQTILFQINVQHTVHVNMDVFTCDP